jgi:hypothetical protein
MLKRKATFLRFMDNTSSNDPAYVTVYLDGTHYGYFHRVSKKHMTDHTTIRPNKGFLFEMKFFGDAWHSISRTEFMLRLSTVNAWRKDRDMPAITLPEPKDEK